MEPTDTEHSLGFSSKILSISKLATQLSIDSQQSQLFKTQARVCSTRVEAS